MLALVQTVSLDGVMLTALVAFGVASLAWLLWHEHRTAEPMLPLSLWRRRVLALSNLAGFGASASYMAVSSLLPTYVQGVMGESPRVAGFVVGAASVSWMFASIAAGRLMIRTSYRLTAAIGGACLLGGAAMLATLGPGGSVLWPASGSFLLCDTTFLVSIQGTVGFHERAVATSSQVFMRMIGMSVGAALFGAILNFGVHRRLPGQDDAVNQLLHAGARQTLASGELARVAEAVAFSAHEAFVVAALIAAVTLLLTLAFPRGLNPTRSLRKSAAGERGLVGFDRLGEAHDQGVGGQFVADRGFGEKGDRRD
jgi:hypothetical protein